MKVCLDCYTKDRLIADDYGGVMKDLSDIITFLSSSLSSSSFSSSSFSDTAKKSKKRDEKGEIKEECYKSILNKIVWHKYFLIRIKSIMPKPLFHQTDRLYDRCLVIKRLERELNMVLELALLHIKNTKTKIATNIFDDWSEINDYISCNRLIKRVSSL